VGTTTDSGEKLQVNGNAILLTGYKIFGNSPSGTTSSFISLYNTTDGGIDLMANFTTSKITFGTAGSERLRITSGGLVGIGNTNPGSYNSGVNNLVVGNLSGFTGITISSGSAQEGAINFADGLTGNQLYRGSISYSHLSDAMWFYTSGGEKMRITSGGDVLVAGTYNPFASSNRGNITLNGSSGNVIGFANGSATRGFIYHDGTNLDISNTTSNSILFSTNGSEKMRITSGGLVGIGTTAPNSLLEVNKTITFSNIDTYAQLVVKTTSGANGKLLNIGVDETNSVSFIQSLNRGTDAMPLSLQRYGGNVGIGTTSPTQKLTIAGSYVRSHSLSEDNTNAGAYFQVKSGSSTVGQSTQFVDNAGNWIIYTGTSSESERMRITSVGNVEINTGSIKTGEPDTGWGRAAIKIGASVSGEAFDVTRYLPVSVDGTVYYINLNSSTP
jgi:hypothetical protein